MRLYSTAADFNVFDPGPVRIYWITGNCNNFCISLFKLWNCLGYHSELSGTHWSEIRRVREKDSPPERKGQIGRKVSQYCMLLTGLQDSHGI